jgi:uncharacterized protein (DUF2252 family)
VVTKLPVPALAPAERAARAKALRAEVPRSSHAEWDPPPDRSDPVVLLEQQAQTRVSELVPIRYRRMIQSPMTFFRGAAYVMASDLTTTPATGWNVQLSGDAHLSNFGGFATPERDLVFDLNDFDETLPGPWEWDVKRLAASVELAGRDRAVGRTRRQGVVSGTVASYRQAMRDYASMPALEVWYSRIRVAELEEQARDSLSRDEAKRIGARLAKARQKDSARAFAKLATTNGGGRIHADPPLVVPIADLMGSDQADELTAAMGQVLRAYRRSLAPAQRQLFDRYEFADMARKVGGIGSVGTRCWILLLLGTDQREPLFLQAKEAETSVLEPFVGASSFKNHGQRVVEGQRLIQGSSDIFLGWLRTTGLDGKERDFYVRQMWDWKVSADVGGMSTEAFELYARLCGRTLARAHARSGDAVAIGAYLGSGRAFDKAVAEFAVAYADQTERDHEALTEAVVNGRVTAAEAG